jgi:hypothetical protein
MTNPVTTEASETEIKVDLEVLARSDLYQAAILERDRLAAEVDGVKAKLASVFLVVLTCSCIGSFEIGKRLHEYPKSASESAAIYRQRSAFAYPSEPTLVCRDNLDDTATLIIKGSYIASPLDILSSTTWAELTWDRFDSETSNAYIITVECRRNPETVAYSP